VPAPFYTGERSAVVERLAADFQSEATRALAARGTFAVALPGGSVATQTFSTLAGLPIDWSGVHFFWADERAVPPSDPESNYAAAEALWLGPARVPAASIHRMPADQEDLNSAAELYARELTDVLGVGARLDYVLLGVGPDGHVASLFPRAAARLTERQLVAAVFDAPKPPARRLTLTMTMLCRAERLAVAAFGEAKAVVLSRVIGDPQSELPLAEVLRCAPRPLVLADRAAAALVKAAKEG